MISTDKTGHCRSCVFKNSCAKCLSKESHAWDQQSYSISQGSKENILMPKVPVLVKVSN